MVQDTFFRFLPFQVHLPSKFAKTANMNKTNFHLEQIQYRSQKRRFDGQAKAQKSEKTSFKNVY
jgi:hypothetical protein